MLTDSNVLRQEAICVDVSNRNSQRTRTILLPLAMLMAVGRISEASNLNESNLPVVAPHQERGISNAAFDTRDFFNRHANICS